MSKTQEALKLALEALEPLTVNAELRGDNFPEGNEIYKMADAGFKAITAIREALAEESSGTGQPAQWSIPQTAGQISDFIGSDYVWREHKLSDVAPHEDDQYCVTAHDLIAAFERLADHIVDANKMTEQPGNHYDDVRESMRQAFEQPAQQDIPDLIAGALGVSRGTAYDLMREALAQQQEPVANLTIEDGRVAVAARILPDGVYDLYTSPPAQRKPWVGLTDEEAAATAYKGFDEYWTEDCNGSETEAWAAAGHAIEAKLREKNA